MFVDSGVCFLLVQFGLFVFGFFGEMFEVFFFVFVCEMEIGVVFEEVAVDLFVYIIYMFGLMGILKGVVVEY